MARQGREESGDTGPGEDASLPRALAGEARACLVVSRFNRDVTRRLEEGARAALTEAGVSPRDIDVIRVPGAWELPFAVRQASSGYDVVVALGCVVRGETPHFEYVCRAATDGLLQCQLDGVPVGFGLLTTESLEQGLARAGGGKGDKGAEAARAALEMLALKARSRGG